MVEHNMLAAKRTITVGWAKDGAPLPSWRARWDGVVGAAILCRSARKVAPL
jgi:hypothetical protein